MTKRAEQSHRHAPGARCVGAGGCGGPREPRETGDARARFLCYRCARQMALRYGHALPGQTAFPFGS